MHKNSESISVNCPLEGNPCVHATRPKGVERPHDFPTNEDLGTGWEADPPFSGRTKVKIIHLDDIRWELYAVR